MTDLDTGAATATTYDNETLVSIGDREVYPFAGQVKSQWVWAPALPNEANPHRVEMTFVDTLFEAMPTKDGQSYFTIPKQHRTRRMQGVHTPSDSLEVWVAGVEANGNATLLRDTTTKIVDVDEYNNVLRVEVSTAGVDLTLAVTRTVKNDTDRWILGLVQSQKECSAAAGLSQCRTITRTTNAFGEVETETRASEDGLADTKLTVAFDERDKYGGVLHTTATDAFGHLREATTILDEHGVHPTKHINRLGHETKVEYDALLGVLKKLIDPNGLITEWHYDSLGRLDTEIRPDGSQTTFKTERMKVDGLWRTIERTTTTGGVDDETILDSLGRPIQTFTFAPQPENGKALRLMQRIEYDRLSGKVARKSVPTAEGTPDAQLKWDAYEYDALRREIRHTTAWNAVTTTNYDGLLVDVTDPLLRHTTTELDALGRPRVITDAANGQTRYTFGPFDTLYTVNDPGGAITTWTRDAFGRVRQLEEPDRGTTTYVNDGFGDVVSSTDALGRTVTFGMDALGRVERRTDKLGAQVSTTSWTWDTAPNGIGKLHSVISADAAKTYTYNERGQTETVKLGVNGDVFSTHFQYDKVGRLEVVDYPQPLGMPTFGVTHDYDAHGHRIAVRDKETRDTYWELADVDQAGRTKEETFGNGVKTTRGYYEDKQALKSMTTDLNGTLIQDLFYDWDPLLNLKMRKDARQPTNTTERFIYDGLNRLTCAYFGVVEMANPACHASYGYAANGNLTSKSDVGTLLYNDPAHPHAVTNAAGGSYGHDAVGNQITRPGGVSITYTAFDLPKTITQPGKTVSYGYDGDQQRIRKTTATSETIYFEDLYERIETIATGAYEHRYYVHSPERAIAVVTRGGANAGTKTLHVDHLGSIETVTNEKGEQVEKRSYDPFGQRRNVVWGLPPPTSFASTTRPGFTGHDEEDEFGLVNMKGRLLDPKFGRFTTTDPVIANVFNGQSFSAYGYVRNNPLTLIDPTGFTDRPTLEVPPENDMIEQTVITEYPDNFVPEPLPEEIRESTNSMRFTTDVGTTGDGAGGIGGDDGPSKGLDVVKDVLAGAASAYGRDVLDTAKGMALFLAFPPGYLAWQGYRFWSGVIGGAMDGYAQDGVFGAVAGAINAVNPFAHVGISLAQTVDAAEKGDYKAAGEHGYRAAVGIVGIFAAAVGWGLRREVVARAAPFEFDTSRIRKG